MKGKTKLLKMAGAFVLVLALLAGCGGGAPTPLPPAAEIPPPEIEEVEQVNLTFATSVYTEAAHRDVINRLVYAYAAQVPHVTITVVELSADQEADIVHVNPSHLARYNILNPEDAFVDLAPRFARTNFLQNLMGQEALVTNDQIFAMSNYAFSTTAIFYRRSKLEEMSIDPSGIRIHEDFREAALRLANNGGYAMGVTQGADEFSSLIARPVSGGLYFSDEAPPFTAENVNINAPENIWAANLWQDWVVTDRLFNMVYNRNYARELFWNGDVAFNIDGPEFINMTNERDPALLDDIGIIPQFNLMFAGRMAIPNPSVELLVTMLSQNSAHQEEAWDFMLWMTGDGAQWLISHSGMVPSSRSFAAMEVYRENNPLESQFFNFMVNYYGPLLLDPFIPEMDDIKAVLQEAAERMFSSEAADVETEMNAAQARVQEIMES